VSSEKKKPGPGGVSVADLLFWEHEWYWVFHGLAFGVPARTRTQRVWEPELGPKLLAWKPESKRPRGFEELDKERLAEWNARPESEKWREVEYNDQMPGIRAEPQVWRQIKSARSTSQIRAAFDRSPIWLNAKTHGRVYVDQLREHAREFLKAKYYRYPGSDRPSSENKRVLHFARAMAGIMEGIGSIRAIDLIRLRQHGTACGCVQCETERQQKLHAFLSEVLGF
jgi:hypothetical protein